MEKVCANCGKGFTRTKVHRVYCSEECRKLAVNRYYRDKRVQEKGMTATQLVAKFAWRVPR